LDIETKRNIDTARDILVGKVPDPKSQVEQITIALIYKFMDDMDKESVSMGGKAGFFTGDYKRYGWSKIFDPRIGGHEMLALYGEAITKLDQNPAIPPLFRDIFKNAYLPYRDPETLKLFLKTINEFTYDHSENLGDAFEYLLSVLGSQGDAGQFRTPRHIIDFMVAAVDPQKNETIIDPACGTAGFLISSYKHIIAANTAKRAGDLLTPAERKKLLANFKGYDISPDMVRLSLVNLYLHNFVQPQIYEYDTLTSEDRWGEYADVIMANPPFMSPKGGIIPHKRFSVQSKRSEVLFVDYIAEHLTPAGRAAVIVPEGIIFQGAGAYKQLRKMLVEKYLYAVVSLPAGVFHPYSGVKTSILLMDRQIATKTNSILFVKIENDGLDLGAQRRPIEKNDLPQAAQLLVEYRREVLANLKSFSVIFRRALELCNALIIPKNKLAENGEYNLTAERYRVVERRGRQKWPMVRLGDVCETSSGGTPLKNKSEYWKNGSISWLKSGEVSQGEIYNTEEKITKLALEESSAKIFPIDTVLVAMYGVTAGQVGLLKIEASTNQAVCGICPTSSYIPKFLYYILLSQKDRLISMSTGGAQPNISQSIIRNLKIPLPPLEVQQEIVAEIEGYQKVIDGARQVVDNWKPQIEIDPDWPMVKLGEVITLQRGYDLPKQEWKDGNYPIVGSNGIIGYHNAYKETGPGVVTGRSGTIGKVHYISDEYYWPHNTSLFVKDFKGNNKQFIRYLLQSIDLKSLGERTAAVPSLDRKNAHQLSVSLPPFEIQQKIVDEIEDERKLVDGCRELMVRYEERIKRVVDGVWNGVE
jgi:type I restriction enzyme M protein